MKYSCTVTIDKPRDHVIALFDNTDNMSKWQDGLVSFTHVSGEFGQVGSTYAIVYKMGKRVVEMVETLVERSLPDRFAATYEAPGVWNLVENTFTELGDEQTQWVVDTEFKCSGFIMIMSWIMPGMFKKQTMKMMTAFKDFAEAN